MRVFIWKRVKDATDNYHPEAGIVVVAPDLAHAHQDMRTCGVPDRCEVFARAPDLDFKCDDATAPIVIVFPDAGCC